MTLDEELDRGAKAERLMRDPMLIEAFIQLDEYYTEAWKDSPLDGKKDRETIFLYLSALREVRAHLTQIAKTGELAASQRDAMTRTAIS
jgi:hypothetical protein|tara:strand:+ start:306 stop:572 length:267 start_codon:yes stop_codon:yes gene_type:complete